MSGVFNIIICLSCLNNENKMISITVTAEIAVEIQQSIAQFESLIAREMSISEDLRYTHKIELYQSKIQDLKKGLSNGFI